MTALVHRLGNEVGREPPTTSACRRRKNEDLELLTGLADICIHDLCHSFPSGTVAFGESLPMIGKLLGHTQVQTTARYAHLAADPIKAAAERVSKSIAAIMIDDT